MQSRVNKEMGWNHQLTTPATECHPVLQNKYIPQQIDQMFCISVSQITQFNYSVQMFLTSESFVKSKAYINNDHFSQKPL